MFMRRHPALHVECLVLSQVKEMHAGGLYLMLRAGTPPESNLIARKIADIRFGVYAAPAYLEVNGEPRDPDQLMEHRCFVHKPPVVTRALDEWEFERAGERRLIKVPRSLVTDDREGMIDAVLAGGGLMRIGMFDPALITSGRLRKVLGEWQCVGGQPIYALYRKSSPKPPKIAAFLEFVGECFAGFDRDEVTLMHNPIFGESVRLDQCLIGRLGCTPSVCDGSKEAAPTMCRTTSACTGPATAGVARFRRQVMRGIRHSDQISSHEDRDMFVESVAKSILVGRVSMTLATLIYGVLPPFVDLTETHAFMLSGPLTRVCTWCGSSGRTPPSLFWPFISSGFTRRIARSAYVLREYWDYASSVASGLAPPQSPSLWRRAERQGRSSTGSGHGCEHRGLLVGAAASAGGLVACSGEECLTWPSTRTRNLIR